MLKEENCPHKTADDLLSKVATLHQLLSETKDVLQVKEEKLQHQEKLIKQQRNQIQQLIEALQLNRQRQFGKKSGPFSVQLDLFDEAVVDAVGPIEEAEEEIQVASYVRAKKVGRKPLPTTLPREQRAYELALDEKVCDCGHELAMIGEEKSEQLEIVPAKMFVVEHIQKKYACKHCEETIKTAAKPLQPIPKSMAGPGLLSHVIVSKFQDHLPLYRQEQQLQRIGVDVPRATLSLWIIRCAQLLMPLEKLMQDDLLNYDIAYSDESPLQALKEKDRAVESKSSMWLFSGGPPETFSYIYRYDPSRSHEVPLMFFEGLKGHLHCDGFSAHEALANKNRAITLSGCLYHVRRKFVEVYKLAKKKAGLAHHVLKLIQIIAKIEEGLRGKPPDVIKQGRLEKAKPILDELYQLLKTKQPNVPPKSALGMAITYALDQWPKLLVYLEDGRLENNNNRSERGIKPFATGRKNWLFCNSVEGAVAAARPYSFIEM